jgi:hypothetical protein
VLVPCLTLADLCKQYAVRPIDFLKIDVEGLERDVVLSGNWEVFRPAVVVIEITAPWTANRRPESAEISQYLAGNGYREIYFDGINAFYLASEARDLATRFSYPPNVLDRFVPVREAELADAAEEARQEVNALTSAAAAADLRSAEAELRARQEGARAEEAETELADAERRASAAQAELQRTKTLLQEATVRAEAAYEELRRVKLEVASANLRGASAEARAHHAEASFAAMERSNSWRITAPLRWLRGRTRRAAQTPAATLRRPPGPTKVLGPSLVRIAVRIAKRSGTYALVAPWMRERHPWLWFRVKGILLDNPARPVPQVGIGAGSNQADTAAPLTTLFGASLDGTNSPHPISVEELRSLIEQEVIRQRCS